MNPIDDHIRAQELFSAYIDNQATADEKNFVVRHLAVCDRDCRAQLAVTRSMIKATRSLPQVKAPRSFVLPRSMARQPAWSFFDWYPALRLATSLAVIAFVLVFAGDLFTQRSVSFNANVPSAANAPKLPTQIALNAAPEAPTAIQPPAPQAFAGVLPTATITASAASADAFARSSVMTSTQETVTLTPMITAEVALAPTTAPQPTIEAGPKVVTSAAPAANPAGAIEPAPAPSIDPLRAIEIALAVLIIALGLATLIARRRTRIDRENKPPSR